jgi:hypothetical protein
MGGPPMTLGLGIIPGVSHWNARCQFLVLTPTIRLVLFASSLTL